MAIYHCTTKPIARSAGRSAVAAAAYRAGEELVDQRTGLVHDYTKKGGVVSAEIIAPDGSSADRSTLWNAAESAEKRKDSRTAREWLVALPAELDAGQRRELAVSFGTQLASRYGVAVDVALHEPDREGDNRNHHAHILTTTRQVSRGAAGELVMGDKASIELSDKKRRELGLGSAADEVKAIRQLWEQAANRALERAGSGERIDGRSLKDQGLDREATTHLGPVASEMERRGRISDRGDGNRQAQANNTARASLSAQVIDLGVERKRREGMRHEAAQERKQALMWGNMTSGQLAGEISRIRPPSLRDAVDRDRDVQKAHRDAAALRERFAEARRVEVLAQQRAVEWREAHPLRAKLRDLGWKWEPLEKLAATEAKNRAQWQSTEPEMVRADEHAKQVQASAWSRVEREQAPALGQVAHLEKLRAEKLRKEQSEQRLERAADHFVKEFKAVAIKRAGKASGYGDSGKQWQSLPDVQKANIERFNAMDKPRQAVHLAEIRATMLQHFRDNPKALEQERQTQQKKNRGMER